MVQLPRLCDLPDGAEIFANAHNALTAREKGILRSRNAQAKYEEVSVQIRSRVRVVLMRGRMATLSEA